MIWDQAPASQRADGLEHNRALKDVLVNEAILVEAAQRGDLSAFNQLVLAYQDDLYGWVFSYVKDMETAVDVTQQAFITAYQKIHTLRYGSFRAWIFRIARNRSIDVLRYQRRHPMLRLDGELQDEEAPDLLSTLTADAPLPEDAVIQSEQAKLLLELLDSLPESYRQVLQLVEIYEMNYQEAASVLNVPLGTLKSRLARARLIMREQIEQRGILC
jgi:RNA polymerase sigma-70 factor, ECF subfamily